LIYPREIARGAAERNFERKNSRDPKTYARRGAANFQLAAQPTPQLAVKRTAQLAAGVAAPLAVQLVRKAEATAFSLVVAVQSCQNCSRDEKASTEGRGSFGGRTRRTRRKGPRRPWRKEGVEREE
jgi:hypothetical protein